MMDDVERAVHSNSKTKDDEDDGNHPKEDGYDGCGGDDGDENNDSNNDNNHNRTNTDDEVIELKIQRHDTHDTDGLHEDLRSGDDGDDDMKKLMATAEEKLRDAAAVAAAVTSDNAAETSDTAPLSGDTVVLAGNESLCQECKVVLARYQCPKCKHRTCSLECVKSHKQRTKCSGKRQRAGDAFIPLARMDDNTIKNDYFFLEEVLEQIPRAGKVAKLAATASASSTARTPSSARAVPVKANVTNTRWNGGDAGNRDGPIIASGTNHTSNHSGTNRTDGNTNQTTRDKMCRRLTQQCELRGINLQIMPSFMERHRQNTSWYSAPLDRITWMVEVIIVPEKQAQQDQQHDLQQQERIVTVKWSEDTNLGELLKQIKPNVDNKRDKSSSNSIDDVSRNDNPSDSSSSFSAATSSSFRLFVKRLPCPASNPRYVELDYCKTSTSSSGSTLRTALKGLTVIEHPTIYCVHHTECYRFPLGTNQILIQDEKQQEN